MLHCTAKICRLNIIVRFKHLTVTPQFCLPRPRKITFSWSALKATFFVFKIPAFRGNLFLEEMFSVSANHTVQFQHTFTFLLLDDDEHDWILKTCRKGWDENVGYRPDLIK